MSKLDKIKNSGFKSPKGYFTNLEDQIIDRIKLEDALINTEASGFVMPEGYLEDVEDKIINRLPSKEVKVVSIFRRQNLLYLSGVAAAVLILFAVLMNTGSSFNIDSLDEELVESYILDADVDTYELAALLTEEELTTLDTEIFDDAFADDSLDDYLLENAVIEDILDQ